MGRKDLLAPLINLSEQLLAAKKLQVKEAEQDMTAVTVEAVGPSLDG